MNIVDCYLLQFICYGSCDDEGWIPCEEQYPSLEEAQQAIDTFNERNKEIINATCEELAYDEDYEYQLSFVRLIETNLGEYEQLGKEEVLWSWCTSDMKEEYVDWDNVREQVNRYV